MLAMGSPYATKKCHKANGRRLEQMPHHALKNYLDFEVSIVNHIIYILVDKI